MKRNTLGLMFVLAGSLVAGPALADGVVRTATLPAAARQALIQDIGAARTSTPQSFEALTRIRGRVAELDAAKRGRVAPIALYLKQLGPQTVIPMLEAIAIDGEQRGDLTDTAWAAWRAGLIEAVGGHRDVRAQPVLLAVLEGPESDPMIVRSAAEAVGKLGTDDAVATLVSMATVEGPKRLAVVDGMGACRRAAVADALVSVVGGAQSDELALAAVRSLGDVGNNRAWKTSSVAVWANEQEAVQSAAAGALVKVLATTGNQGLRKAASNALMVVDYAGTPALLTAAQTSASAEAKAVLEAAAKRFERNPAR